MTKVERQANQLVEGGMVVVDEDELELLEAHLKRKLFYYEVRGWGDKFLVCHTPIPLDKSKK